jgi:hypothetical protein
MPPSLKKPGQDQIAVPPVLRLVVEPDGRPGWFVARLESGAEVLARSHQPLVDAARHLLEVGADPDMMLTMRMHDRPYDSFKPAPIGQLAQWTYTEGETTPVRRQAWKPRQMPIAAVTGAQKSGSATGREESFTLGQNRPLVDRLTALEGSS